MTQPSPAQPFTLRDYQLGAIDATRLALAKLQAASRPLRVLVVAPTGAGKTLIASEMIRRARERSARVLFLAHRRELLDQTSAKLDAMGVVDHGVIQSGHPREMPFAPVQVASVQTLARRPQMPPADLIFVDEAHHARAGTYQKILDAYPDKPVVGLTATPWRIDGKGLGELFEDMVVAARPAELIKQGHLVPYTGFAYDSPDAGALKVKGADYDQHGLELVMGSRKLVGNIVEQWLAHAGGARTICFGVTVEHSRSIAQRFIDAGVAAEHLDGTTPVDQRAAILHRLAVGATRVLCNVQVLTEGWDCPLAECCILGRPTLSLTLALQMVGRVLRPAPGKSIARIHDHAGIFIQHGAPDADRDYRLDADVRRTSTLRPAPLRTCKECLRIYDPSADGQACPACGRVNEPSKREIREIEGPQVRAIPLHELPQFRGASEEKKQAHWRKLVAEAQDRGHAAGAAAHKFKAIYGHWPRRGAA